MFYFLICLNVLGIFNTNSSHSLSAIHKHFQLLCLYCFIASTGHWMNYECRVELVGKLIQMFWELGGWVAFSWAITWTVLFLYFSTVFLSHLLSCLPTFFCSLSSFVVVVLVGKYWGQHSYKSSTFSEHAECCVLPLMGIVNSCLGRSFACRKPTVK